MAAPFQKMKDGSPAVILKKRQVYINLLILIIIKLVFSFFYILGHAYYPKNEKIMGHYLSSDHSEKFQSQNQRRTSFSSNTLVPDLNVFTEGPGTGKYSFKQTIGRNSLESNIENQPQFTIPKSSRSISELSTEVTPGPAHYTVSAIKEKVPGHYSFSKGKEKPSSYIFL